MTITILGYGKMGRLIEERVLERGWHCAAVIDPFYGRQNNTSVTVAGTPVYKNINDMQLDPSAGTPPVALDFTHPDAVYQNIIHCAQHKIPLVVGTTGWYDKLSDVQKIVTQAGACLLWAGNFSLGINLFYKLAEYAAHLVSNFADYDVGGYEFHHNKKADSPSGTAKIIAQKVLAAFPHKKSAVYTALDRPPAPSELHFASMRCGAIPGTHALVFDSPADTIEIKHTARSREALVAGALAAAAWLEQKAASGASGIWTFENVLE